MPSTTPEDSQGIEAIQFEKQGFPLGVAAPGCVRLAHMGGIYDEGWLEYTDSATNQRVHLPQPGARAHRTTSQSIPPSVATVLSFPSERWDTDGMHSNSVNPSRITCTRVGVYLITAQVSWASTSTFNRTVELLLNGSTVLARSHKRASLESGIMAMTTYLLGAGDYVEVRVTQDTAGNLEVEAQPYSPEFTVTRIG